MKHSGTISRRTRELSTILLLAVPTMATAQIAVAEGAAETSPEAPAEATQGASENRFIEEIVITAQKREENLQDVPISVQAFSADALDAKGIEEPKALQLATPGLQYNLVAGYSLIYIRGVGTDAYLPSADASVATYIDNVYYPFGHGLASALGNIERIEILKGPQGTLFGRNSTGGAINIVTKQPGPDAETSIQLSHESFDKNNFRVFTNIPISDSLAVSVSGLRYSESSYYDLTSNSTRRYMPDEVSKAASVKLGWNPIDALTAVIGYNIVNSTGAIPMSVPAAEIKPLGVLVGVTAAPDYKTSEDAPSYIDTDARVATLDVKYATPWFDARFIGADQSITSPGLADYDGSNQPLLTFEVIGQFADIQTAELQFLSNADSWGSDWLQWIGGLYYIKSSAGFDPILFTVAPNVLTRIVNPQGGLLSQLFPATEPLRDLLNQIVMSDDIPGINDLAQLVNNGVSLALEGVLDTRSTAAFFQTTANLSDQLALTLGGRYQKEERELVKSNTNFAPDPARPKDNIRLINFGSRKADTSNFSPKAVLDYKFGDNDMAYLSYAKGFKSGTFNIVAIYSPTQYVVPEEVTTYELGYKGVMLDGTLRFNGAIFQNTIKNLQTQTISITSGGATRFETAGSARIRGADFDALWQVAPDALPGLVITGGAAYLDGTYTDYSEGSGYDETTGLFFDGTIPLLPRRDFTGNRIVRTPKFSGNFGSSYTWDLAQGSIEVAADVYHNSGSYFTAQNTKAASEDAYDVVNARISYFHAPWNMRVTAFGKNITDAKYHYAIIDLDLQTSKLLAPPSTYGVRVNWDF